MCSLSLNVRWQHVEPPVIYGWHSLRTRYHLRYALGAHGGHPAGSRHEYFHAPVRWAVHVPPQVGLYHPRVRREGLRLGALQPAADGQTTILQASCMRRVLGTSERMLAHFTLGYCSMSAADMTSPPVQLLGKENVGRLGLT